MTDEMKPVRCGCGGEAVIYVTHWWGKCYVCECEECGTASRPCTTEAEAVTAWNRAMGATDTNVGDKQPERKKGEWIYKPNEYDDSTYECSQCGEPWTLIDGTPEENNMKFCPNCGADMRGE